MFYLRSLHPSSLTHRANSTPRFPGVVSIDVEKLHLLLVSFYMPSKIAGYSIWLSLRWLMFLGYMVSGDVLVLWTIKGEASHKFCIEECHGYCKILF
jgi:hypothetical protein